MSSLVILAAGMSRRFGSAKQFQAVGPDGEALMDFSIYDAIAAGCNEVVLILHAGLEAEARKRFGNRFGIPVRWVLQNPAPFPGRSKPWGTGHAILAALKTTDHPVVVINADDFYGREPVMEAFRHARTHPDTNAIIGFGAAQTLSGTGGVSRGLISHRDGEVRAVTEIRNLERADGRLRGVLADGEFVFLEPDTPVSMNLWVLAPGMRGILESAFAGWHQRYGTSPDLEFQIGDVATTCIAKHEGSFHLLTAQGRTYGMTFAEDRDIVRRQIASLTRDGEYPSPLFKD